MLQSLREVLENVLRPVEPDGGEEESGREGGEEPIGEKEGESRGMAV